MIGNTTSSATYRLLEQAMRQRKQIVCHYGAYRRELCLINPPGPYAP
jgi:hypothetical protein